MKEKITIQIRFDEKGIDIETNIPSWMVDIYVDGQLIEFKGDIPKELSASETGLLEFISKN